MRSGIPTLAQAWVLECADWSISTDEYICYGRTKTEAIDCFFSDSWNLGLFRWRYAYFNQGGYIEPGDESCNQFAILDYKDCVQCIYYIRSWTDS